MNHLPIASTYPSFKQQWEHQHLLTSINSPREAQYAFYHSPYSPALLYLLAILLDNPYHTHLLQLTSRQSFSIAYPSLNIELPIINSRPDQLPWFILVSQFLQSRPRKATHSPITARITAPYIYIRYPCNLYPFYTARCKPQKPYYPRPTAY